MKQKKLIHILLNALAAFFFARAFYHGVKILLYVWEEYCGKEKAIR